MTRLKTSARNRNEIRLSNGVSVRRLDPSHLHLEKHSMANTENQQETTGYCKTFTEATRKWGVCIGVTLVCILSLFALVTCEMVEDAVHRDDAHQSAAQAPKHDESLVEMVRVDALPDGQETSPAISDSDAAEPAEGKALEVNRVDEPTVQEDDQKTQDESLTD